MFFGLSMRQFVFSLLAVGVAVGLYFLLRPHFGMETVSWMVILAAAPFAMLGFLSYHGMTAEQFIRVWLRSELIEPKQLYVQVNNIYYDMVSEFIKLRIIANRKSHQEKRCRSRSKKE